MGKWFVASFFLLKKMQIFAIFTKIIDFFCID